MGGKLQNKEMREKVFELCETLGFWNVRPVLLAEKVGTAHQNISRWKKAWINKYGLPNIEQYGKELNVNSLTALKELIRLMKNEDEEIRIKAIRAFFLSQEKFTRFLENFGYKEQITSDIPMLNRQINLTPVKISQEQALEEFIKNRKIEDKDKSP